MPGVLYLPAPAFRSRRGDAHFTRVAPSTCGGGKSNLMSIQTRRQFIRAALARPRFPANVPVAAAAFFHHGKLPDRLLG